MSNVDAHSIRTAPLFHITTEAELHTARPSGEYRPEAFAREGFVHCSYRSQVAATANRIFRGRAGLVLLEIHRARLTCPVVDENLDGGPEMFPHVYGAIPIAAIAQVHSLVPDADGTFELPAGLQQ
jgi:uncharacterized protein (DUF952 family)